MSSQFTLTTASEDIDPRFTETVRWLKSEGYEAKFAGFIGIIPLVRLQVEPGLVISEARIIYTRLRDMGLNVDPKRSNRVVVEGLHDPATEHGTITIYNILDSIFLQYLNASEVEQED